MGNVNLTEADVKCTAGMRQIERYVALDVHVSDIVSETSAGLKAGSLRIELAHGNLDWFKGIENAIALQLQSGISNLQALDRQNECHRCLVGDIGRYWGFAGLQMHARLDQSHC